MKLTKIEKIIYLSIICACLLCLTSILSIKSVNANEDGNCYVATISNDSWLQNGSSKLFYNNKFVQDLSSCLSETWTCNDGSISGKTFGYGWISCDVPHSCYLNDGEYELPHGSGTNVYKKTEVPYGEKCSSTIAVCNNGSTDKEEYGYAYTHCDVLPASSCYLDDGEYELPHGSGKNVYKNAEVPYNKTCFPVYASCNNGSIEISEYGYSYTHCDVLPALGCEFEDLDELAQQGGIGYKLAVMPYGYSAEKVESQKVYCDNGQWKQKSCQSYYCNEEDYNYIVYSDYVQGSPKSCKLKDGGEVEHGSIGYTLAVVPFWYSDEEIDSLVVNCYDGSWYEGSEYVDGDDPLQDNEVYLEYSMTNPDDCNLVNGESVEHRGTAYKTSTVPYGYSALDTLEILCWNGKRYDWGTMYYSDDDFIDADYLFTYDVAYPSYSILTPKNCDFSDGNQAEHLGTGYKRSIIPYGSASCSDEVITCYDGNWYSGFGYSSSSEKYEDSGYGRFGTCEIGTAGDCVWNGEEILHGDNIVAYTKDSEEYQNSCAPKSLTCDNGQWKDENQIVVPYSSCTSTTTCVPGAEAEGRVYDIKDVTVTRNADTNNWDVPVCEWSCDEEKYHREGDVCVVNYKAPSYSGGGGGSRTPSTTVNEHNSADDKQDNKKQIIEKVDISVVEDTQKHSSEEMKGAVIKVEDKELDIRKYNPRYTPEFNKAYQFAYNNGITTVETIKDAKMYTPIKRIEMAKMLSYFAMNVLDKVPDTSRGTIKFKDVTNKMNAQYDNAVTLAYQLGIMGINMPNNTFRPNDNMTRGEFATALSRLVYGTDDGEGRVKYYAPHMAKLYNEGIISEQNPKLKEFRGYVMIMLERIAELEKDSEVEGDENLEGNLDM